MERIGGLFGTLIFDAIFPPVVPSYFDEVYKQIEKIVNKELTQNTIDEINGQINGLKDWVAITYTNAKESGMTVQNRMPCLITGNPMKLRKIELLVYIVPFLWFSLSVNLRAYSWF